MDHPTDTNKKEYRVKFNQFKKDCKRAKTKDWWQFLESTSDFNDKNKLRKILERGKQNSLGVLSKNDGFFFVSPPEQADMLKELSNVDTFPSAHNSWPGTALTL